jgi:hypothetical protein
MTFMKKATIAELATIDNSLPQDGSSNLGDYRLFRNRRDLVTREGYGNQRQSRNVIFPGEVVLADAPNRNFTYYWYCPFGGDRGSMEAELEGLLDGGWEIVKPEAIGGKWKVSNRFRLSPEGYVTWAGHILYALPAEVVEQREADERRANNASAQIAGTLGQFAQAHDGQGTVGGFQPFVKFDGQTKTF